MLQSTQPITGTILVADDQTANRELLEELLTTQGLKVITVADGAAALEESTRSRPDLVILGVMMPHLNGFEVCERIKRQPRHLLGARDFDYGTVRQAGPVRRYQGGCR